MNNKSFSNFRKIINKFKQNILCYNIILTLSQYLKNDAHTHTHIKYDTHHALYPTCLEIHFEV